MRLYGAIPSRLPGLTADGAAETILIGWRPKRNRLHGYQPFANSGYPANSGPQKDIVDLLIWNYNKGG